MEKSKFYFGIGVLLLMLAVTSCKDEMSKYYERPNWIKGNCYEVLEEDGNYSIFLKGIDLAGYHDMVDGKSILTVMAPDDEAFREYLKAEGLNSIEEMDSVELDKLIGFHLMYYAYSKDKLINFRPQEGDDVTDEEKLVNAGMYYKHRTKSRDRNTVLFDETRGIDVTIYHQERFLPVFSYQYFNTKLIKAKENYEYFFPNTPWTGDGGFQVANASVTEYEQITSNGYVHKISKVLKPLNTIYQELASDSDFSDFLKLYRRNEYFAYDENLTLNYGNGTRLYQHYFSQLPNISCEWPVTSYSMMTQLSSQGYSIFAPTNDALNTFFNNYWAKGGYASLSEVSKESVDKLLYNCIYADDIAFPEEITEGKIENSYGAIINFDVNAVPEKYRILCQNGLLYGCTELPVPAMFASVTGPAYQYKDFSYYLMMLTSIGSIQNTLWSDETRLLSLMPSNAQIESKGIKYDKVTKSLMWSDNSALSSGFKTSTTYAHLVDLSNIPGNYQELDSTGTQTQVLKTFSPDYTFYWYVMNVDGKGQITNSFKFNERIYADQKGDSAVFAPFHELKSYTADGDWSNGKAYSYEGSMLVGDPAETNQKSFQALMYSNKVNKELPYYCFSNLLIKAGMYTGQSFNFNLGETCLMFVPNNEAVLESLKSNQIPGINLTADPDSVDLDSFEELCVVDATNDSLMAELTSYLKKYFVPLSTAGITNYPYHGWGETTTKGMETLDVQESEDPETKKVVYTTTRLMVEDAADAMYVYLKDSSNKIPLVDEYHYFPFVFNDGCVQFITRCF